MFELARYRTRTSSATWLAPWRSWTFLPYPQRIVPKLNWVDRTVRYLSAYGFGLLRARRLGKRRFIESVEKACKQLTGLPDDALLTRAEALRVLIAREGLSVEHMVLAFALVRQVITRQIGIAHRPVQVYGARLLLDGKLLEMATGEGKSATAALAAGVAAMAGMNPHIITVNDYLAERDKTLFEPAFLRLGLSTGLVGGEMSPTERRVAYARDIVYVNNKDIAFDYLKDLLTVGRARSLARQRLRSVFGDPEVDAPQQPLILSGMRLAIVDEADSILVDEAGTPLIISAVDDQPQDVDDYLTALQLAGDMRSGLHFTVIGRERRVKLTPAGRRWLEGRSSGLDGLWLVARAREDRVRQALSALHLFHRDAQYIVGESEDGPAIQIVDEFTGRVMADRSWEGGLHQMIEVKEGLPPTGIRRTIARITYQRFFRQYLRLSSMTGTGIEIAAEMRSFFDLDTVAVPTHRPIRRRHVGTRLVPGLADKHVLIADRVRELVDAGRAVLIGTRTVERSETLSMVLSDAGLHHRVLNARQNAEEAELISSAGQPGAVTIATNMAGRGTDIVLHRDVEAAGGLHVILTEFHESRRIDRQLYGRAGRQGDRGSTEDIVAFEDELFERFCPHIKRLMGRLPGANVSPAIAHMLRRCMQRRAERESAAARRLQFTQEHEIARMMAISGREH